MAVSRTGRVAFLGFVSADGVLYSVSDPDLRIRLVVVLRAWDR
jgi:hypothetical protein